MVKCDEVVDSLLHERMSFCREHKVIGNTHRNSLGKCDRVGEERIHATKTPNVQININATKVVEDKITDGIRTLDVVLVTVKGLKEPRVILCNKSSRTVISP